MRSLAETAAMAHRTARAMACEAADGSPQRRQRSRARPARKRCLAELHAAVVRGEIDAVRAQLAGSGVSADVGRELVNRTDGHGDSALTKCSRRGHVNVARLLLAVGAEVDAQNADGYTALMLSCYWDHTEMVDLLLSKGADATMRSTAHRECAGCSVGQMKRETTADVRGDIHARRMGSEVEQRVAEATAVAFHAPASHRAGSRPLTPGRSPKTLDSPQKAAHSEQKRPREGRKSSPAERSPSPPAQPTPPPAQLAPTPQQPQWKAPRPAFSPWLSPGEVRPAGRTRTDHNAVAKAASAAQIHTDAAALRATPPVRRASTAGARRVSSSLRMQRHISVSPTSSDVSDESLLEPSPPRQTSTPGLESPSSPERLRGGFKLPPTPVVAKPVALPTAPIATPDLALKNMLATDAASRMESKRARLRLAVGAWTSVHAHTRRMKSMANVGAQQREHRAKGRVLDGWSSWSAQSRVQRVAVQRSDARRSRVRQQRAFESWLEGTGSSSGSDFGDQEAQAGNKPTTRQADSTDTRRASQLQEIYARADRDGDGRLTRAELILRLRKDEELRELLVLPAHVGDGERDIFEAVFQGMDVDDDRCITVEEFVRYIGNTVAAVEGPQSQVQGQAQSDEIDALEGAHAAELADLRASHEEELVQSAVRVSSQPIPIAIPIAT